MAVRLSCEAISEAKDMTRSAACLGVEAPRARSEISSSDTIEETPSDTSVMWEYSGPARAGEISLRLH